jgi:hypothetical protein
MFSRTSLGKGMYFQLALDDDGSVGLSIECFPILLLEWFFSAGFR